MNETLFESDRVFQVWSYNVSMSQLLLRSNQSADRKITTRVDIMFQGVAFISLPNMFTGLKIVKLASQDISAFSLPRTLYQGEKIFELSGEGYKAHVIAYLCVWHEDTGEYHEPSYWQKRHAEFQACPRS